MISVKLINTSVLVTGCRLQDTGYWIYVMGCKIQDNGCRMGFLGYYGIVVMGIRKVVLGIWNPLPF